jgi:Spy/CpxP family protein refolding chaperone
MVLALILAAATVLPTPALAQRGGGASSGAPPMRANTPFEDFVEELRLDDKSQVPAVQQVMIDGAKGATALVTELFQARQTLLNLELTNKPADKPAALQAYVAGATKMAAAEAATFAKVYALLRPNQQSRAPGGFTQMAGFFFPEANPGQAGRGASGGALGRLDIFTNLFALDGDQKKEIRGWLDEAHKTTATARKGLIDTRATLAKAIQSGGDQAAIDAAAAAYAMHVTTMTDAEMTILARIIQRLTPEQRGNQRAISTAFALMRGVFVNDRKWDIVPDRKTY